MKVYNKSNIYYSKCSGLHFLLNKMTKRQLAYKIPSQSYVKYNIILNVIQCNNKHQTKHIVCTNVIALIGS